MADTIYYAPKYYGTSATGGYPYITGKNAQDQVGYAYFRIAFTCTLNKSGRLCTVKATFQMCSPTSFGLWSGTLHGTTWEKRTLAKAKDTETWTDMFSTEWDIEVGSDGAYTVEVKGSLNGPSATSLAGKTKSTSRSIKFTDGTPSTITVTYKWISEDGTKTESDTQDYNTAFNLRSAPSGYSEEGATYTCTIDGGEGSYSGSSTRSSTHSTNYSFSNWISSTGVTYNAGASVSFKSNQTFKAQYSSSESHTSFYWPYKSDFSHSEDSSSFTITGAGNGGADRSISATEKTPYVISDSLSSSLGGSYTFGGYDYLAEWENGMSVYPEWTKGTPTYSNNKISDLGSTSREADSEIGYSVSFDYATGTIDQTINNSYTFEGWYNDASGGTKYPDTTEFKSDATVYAHWTKTQKAEAIVLLDPDPKPGYEFLGWLYNEKIITGDDFASMIPTTPGESITLTASWKAKGLARIYVDGTYKQALCYIFDGTSYCQAMPYIYDGEKYRLGG